MQRYLGNKTKLLHEIEQFIEENNIQGSTFFDLFSGTGSVAKYFKAKYKVSSNDILYFSYVVQSAILGFESAPNFKKFVNKYKKNPIDHLNELETKHVKNKFFEKNFSEKAKRLYYSNENAKKIDAIREEIENLKDKKIINSKEYFYLLSCLISEVNSRGNTCGTFGAFIKKPTNSFYKPLELKEIQLGIGNIGKAYNLDYIEALKKISADIIYVDPPYTAIDYSQAYHLLETLSINDRPKLKGITGRRVNAIPSSPFVKEKTVMEAFDKLFKLAKTDNLILSYSTHGIAKIEDLKMLMSKYFKNIIVKKISYKKYITGLGNEKGDLSELLILGKGKKNG